MAASRSIEDSALEPGGVASQLAAGRLYAFRVTYVAIFGFILLYVFTVEGTEALLHRHFVETVAEAVQVDDLTVPIAAQIQTRINRRVLESPWVRLGGAHVSVMVLGSDGETWLYVAGRAPTPSAGLGPAEVLREAARLLPATAEVITTVPHNALLSNAILVTYAAILLTGLFSYNRTLARREARRLDTALTARDGAALRAEGIERELEVVRERLLGVEPTERAHAEEIAGLQRERQILQAKLGSLALREEELRGKAAQAVELDQERQALEDLLEEASSDLASKDEEIRALERRLKRAARGAGASGGRSREADMIARRLRTLYKTVEIDDRAVQDIVALRDETMKLKAEEAVKRLADESENVGVRRKVGGLPPHLSIFELGFAGKGRVYYSKGRQRRFRILTVGAKNSQKTDLEYLSRLTDV